MAALFGLDVLLEQTSRQAQLGNAIGYLCHSASIDRTLNLGLYGMKRVFGDRLKKVFSPQHGLFSDVQDNMVETKDSFNPFFGVHVHSLYSDTRIPTESMLADLDTVVVDLQDVGCRIYTYIYTMTLLMEACGKKGIRVVVLDRPNPIGGEEIEGGILDMEFRSFVGRHPLPARHGLTIGEVAVMAKECFGCICDLVVVPMQGWSRDMSFDQTGLPWVLPSPNLATVDAAYTFVGTVLYEGTNISEGRGTTRSLEIVGHPGIDPFAFRFHLEQCFSKAKLSGFVLRPLYYLPTFQKHKGVPCGGYQIHTLNRKLFKPWKVCQILCREFFHHLGEQFAWKDPPYEYEYHKLPVDLINGGSFLREWVEKNGTDSELDSYEQLGREEYLKKRQQYLLY